MPLILLTIVPFPWLNPVGPHSILKVPPKGLEPTVQSIYTSLHMCLQKDWMARQLGQASTANKQWG